MAPSMALHGPAMTPPWTRDGPSIDVSCTLHERAMDPPWERIFQRGGLEIQWTVLGRAMTPHRRTINPLWTLHERAMAPP